MTEPPLAPGKHVEVGGRRVHYVEKGSGPTVVLVHGFFFHTVMWRETMDALAPHFRCIAVDLFGFGWSDRPRAPAEVVYGYDLWRDQLAGFLDALKIERAHLVGQSLGGGTIISFAVQQPKRVATAVLVCPAGLPNPADKNRSPLIWPLVGELAFKLLGPKRLVRKVLVDHFMHDPRKVTDAYVEAVAEPTTLDGSSAAALWIMRNVNLGGIPERFPAYGKLGIPTLLIWGKNDKGIPVATAEVAREALKPERVLLIDDAGHNPHQERPEVANPVILEFLSAHARAPAPAPAMKAATP